MASGWVSDASRRSIQYLSLRSSSIPSICYNCGKLSSLSFTFRYCSFASCRFWKLLAGSLICTKLTISQSCWGWLESESLLVMKSKSEKERRERSRRRRMMMGVLEELGVGRWLYSFCLASCTLGLLWDGAADMLAVSYSHSYDRTAPASYIQYTANITILQYHIKYPIYPHATLHTLPLLPQLAFPPPPILMESQAMRSHLVLLEGLVVELCEEGVGVLEEFLGVVVFLEHAALEDEDAVGVDDGVESVGHRDDGAVLEGLVHGLVDNRFRPHVDVGSGLVDQHDTCWLQDCPCDAHQLSLSHTQVLTVLSNFGLKALAGVHGFVKGAESQGSGELLVGVLVEGVQVLHGSGSTSRMVPAKRQGSCRMMVILDRRSSRLNCEMSLPSSTILPSAASRMRKRHIMMVDLPEPVLPTTPILWPPWNVTVSPLRTRSRFFLYLHLRSTKSMRPRSGHPSAFMILLSFDFIFSSSRFFRYWTQPASGSRFMKDSQRSMEMSQFSKLLRLTQRKYMIQSIPREQMRRRPALAAAMTSLSDLLREKKKMQPREERLMIMETRVSLNVNHTSTAFLAMIGFLFSLIFSQFLWKNMSFTLQDRIVATPDRISEKQETMGDLVNPSMRVSSRWGLTTQLRRMWQRARQTIMMGMKMYQGAMMKMTTMLLTRKKMKTRVLLKSPGRVESTVLRSLERRLKMRPRGTRSKNSLREEKSRLLIMLSWMISLMRGEEKETMSARMKAKVPQRKPITTYTSTYSALLGMPVMCSSVTSRLRRLHFDIHRLLAAFDAIHTTCTKITIATQQQPLLQRAYDRYRLKPTSPPSSSAIINSFDEGAVGATSTFFSLPACLGCSDFLALSFSSFSRSMAVWVRLFLVWMEASLMTSASIFSSSLPSSAESFSAASISSRLMLSLRAFFSSFIMLLQMSLKRLLLRMVSQLPCSTIRPFSIISTLSTYFRQQRACVISILVFERENCRRDSVMRNLPTWTSTADSRSSRRRMSDSEQRERAKEIRAFCPPERVAPFSPIMVWSPWVKSSKSRLRQAKWMVSSYFLRLKGLPNRMLFMTVSLTIQGFCVTRLMVPLTATRGRGRFSLNFISPSSEYMREDLPEPISPITATISPFLMLKLRSVRVSGGSCTTP